MRPGTYPTSFRRVTNRSARNRDAAPEPDQTTNPGVPRYFLEVGHRAAGLGLAHNGDPERAARFSRKQPQPLNTYTNPSSRDYGHLSTPPYRGCCRRPRKKAKPRWSKWVSAWARVWKPAKGISLKTAWGRCPRWQHSGLLARPRRCPASRAWNDPRMVRVPV